VFITRDEPSLGEAFDDRMRAVALRDSRVQSEWERASEEAGLTRRSS